LFFSISGEAQIYKEAGGESAERSSQVETAGPAARHQGHGRPRADGRQHASLVDGEADLGQEQGRPHRPSRTDLAARPGGQREPVLDRALLQADATESDFPRRRRG